MCPESPIYQKQQLPGSESVSFCISALMGGSECSFLSVGHTPSRRKSVGKCPKTARARSAYLTDPLHHGALSCNAPAEHVAAGATEAGSRRTRIHGGWDLQTHHPLLATDAREKGPPLALLSPDPGSCISRARGRGQPRQRGHCARPLLRCPDFPQLSLALTIGLHRAPLRPSPSSSAPWR